MNPYKDTEQNVYITDPSGRLSGGGLNAFFFPFTPNISVMNTANYTAYELTHANFQQRVFDSGANAEISVTAPMIVRNEEEAMSVMQGSNFFRAAMKMGFGESDPQAGLPPPILRFYAYGIYTNVPVVVTNFTWNFDNDVDYVESGSIRIPKVSTFVLGLATTYGPKNVRQNFSIEAYANGRLKGRGYV